MYWITSSGFTTVMALIMKIPPIRKFFNIPIIPKNVQEGQALSPRVREKLNTLFEPIAIFLLRKVPFLKRVSFFKRNFNVEAVQSKPFKPSQLLDRKPNIPWSHSMTLNLLI